METVRATTMLLLMTLLTEFTRMSVASSCQRSRYIDSSYGTVSEPLYPEETLKDDVGLKSCWYLNNSLEEDYIVGVKLNKIDFGGNLDTTFWFSGHPPVYRKVKTPSCFLYIRRNNTCSRDDATIAMRTMMPGCRGKKLLILQVEGEDAKFELSSNVIKDWKSKKLSFEIAYRFLPCGIGTPVLPGGGYLGMWSAKQGKPEIGGTVPPCDPNASFDKQQSVHGDLLPAVIALAVLLAIALIALVVVTRRLRKTRHSIKQQTREEVGHKRVEYHPPRSTQNGAGYEFSPHARNEMGVQPRFANGMRPEQSWTVGDDSEQMPPGSGQLLSRDS